MNRVKTYRRNLVTFLSVVALTALYTPSTVQAQQSNGSNTSTNSQQPVVDPLEDLKQQFAELTARLDILKAERAILEYSLPRVTDASLPLTGTTTFAKGEMTFESRILAYQALQEVVGALAVDINDEAQEISTLVVLDKEKASSVAAYQYYYYLFQSLNEAYESESSGQESISPSLAVLEAPTIILRSVADFLALFRTNTTINNFALTLPREALVAPLARQLRSDSPHSISVFYPDWYSQDYALIQGQLQQLFKSKSEAEASVRNLSSEERKGKEERLAALQKTFESFTSVLSKAENLAAISQGAKITQVLSIEGSYVLFFTLEAGGSNRTTQNLFSGTRTRHSGGVILIYALFNPQGETVTSNTLYYHTGYLRVPTNESITNIQ